MASTVFDPSSTRLLALDLEHGATRISHVANDNAVFAGHFLLAMCFVARTSLMPSSSAGMHWARGQGHVNAM